MKNSYLIASLMFSVFFYSCGNSQSEKTETPRNADTLLEIGTVQKGFQPFDFPVDLIRYNEILNQKLQERRLAGKVQAVSHKELAKLLPREAEGFAMKGKPNGSTMKEDSMSYSTAVYFKGNDSLIIRLYDYNTNLSLFGGATGRWIGFAGKETAEEKSGWLKWSDDVWGWETLNKTTGDAELSLAVGCRYFVMITAAGQKNTDLITAAAKKLELEKLKSF